MNLILAKIKDYRAEGPGGPQNPIERDGLLKLKYSRHANRWSRIRYLLPFFDLHSDHPLLVYLRTMPLGGREGDQLPHPFPLLVVRLKHGVQFTLHERLR